MAAKKSVNYRDVLEVARNEFNKEHKGSRFLSQADMRDVYLSLRDAIVSQIEAGNEVAFPEFIKFELVKRKSHNARNPLTGEVVKVPAKTVVKVRNRKRLYEITK